MTAKCEHIFKEETEKQLKTLKRFRESWLNKQKFDESDLFKYADDDFYFYRFAINCQEKKKEELLQNIIFPVLDVYSIDFKCRINKRALFNFIITEIDRTVGFLFDSYDCEEIFNAMERDNIDYAYRIVTSEKCEKKFYQKINKKKRKLQ